VKWGMSVWGGVGRCGVGGEDYKSSVVQFRSEVCVRVCGTGEGRGTTGYLAWAVAAEALRHTAHQIPNTSFEA
jgi:hypothetical protein